MEQIWSPWRMEYLEGTAADNPECFLCVAGGGGTDSHSRDVPENDEVYRVVWRGRHTYALLNAYPYANGHVLIAPYAHVGDLTLVSDAGAEELMSAVRLIVNALGRAYRADGYNVGANLGRVAGAGFADHLHFHVVPRWDADTNFMTTVGATRVIPEDLYTTASRIRAAVAETQSGVAPRE